MGRKIDGTFFEFRHHNTAEGKYWNPALKQFQAQDWKEKIREIHSLGMEYVVVMATALYETCFYESKISSIIGSTPLSFTSSTRCCALNRFTSFATNRNILAAVSFTT